MKSFSASEYQARKAESAKPNKLTGRQSTLARVRRFQEADKVLQEACARLGIETPVMTV
jgi:hypothetical protein